MWARWVTLVYAIGTGRERSLAHLNRTPGHAVDVSIAEVFALGAWHATRLGDTQGGVGGGTTLPLQSATLGTHGPQVRLFRRASLLSWVCVGWRIVAVGEVGVGK